MSDTVPTLAYKAPNIFCSLAAGPGVKMCVMDMLEEFTEIKKLGQTPELAHRLDRYYVTISAGNYSSIQLYLNHYSKL